MSDIRNEVRRDVLASLPTFPHGRLLISPRVGKTPIIIDIIKRDKPKSILWVTPLAELAEGGIQEEFIKFKAKKYLQHLETVTWASLHTIKGYYDSIILDEEQYITENNVSTLLSGELRYGNIISMTGTPTKSESKLDLYKKLNLKVLYYLPIKEALTLDVLSDYEITVLLSPLSHEKDIEVKTKSGQTFKTSEVAQYNYYSNNISKGMNAIWRRRTIAEGTTKHKLVKNLLKDLKGRKLIFAPSIAFADKISPNTYHGKSKTNKSLLSFIAKETDELCLVNKAGIGVTFENVEHIIMVQVDSDDNGLTTQKIMRGLLKDGTKVNIWILCATKTQDEVWVRKVLENFNENKIKYVNVT